jgi:hypothetical protein
MGDAPDQSKCLSGAAYDRAAATNCAQARMTMNDWVEVYGSVYFGDGVMVWYRNPDFGPEWPSMSFWMVPHL